MAKSNKEKLQLVDSLAVRYRPKQFSDIVGNTSNVKTIKGFLQKGQLPRTWLFSGNPGSGKTTSARLLAMTVNCENIGENIRKGIVEPCLECSSCKLAMQNKHPDIIEINSGGEEGNAQGIRDLIASMKLAPRFNVKCFIIDEAHLMSATAKSNLLKPMEEPPKHVLWAVCTTDPDKLPKAALTRCIKLYYEYPPLQDVAKKLWKVAKTEYSSDVASRIKPFIKQIAQNTSGQMRDSYSLLETMASVVESDPNASDEELTQEFVTVLTSLGELSVPAIRFITHAVSGKYALPLGITGEIDQSRFVEFLSTVARHAHYASLYMIRKHEGTLRDFDKRKFYGVNFIRFDKALDTLYDGLSKKYPYDQIQYRIVALCGGVLEAINKNRQGLLSPEQSVFCAINTYMRDMQLLNNSLEK